MTDPNFDQDYKDSAASAGGLTREMKMLIGALMILLMVGGLLYYFRSLNAGDDVTAVTTSETTTSTTTVVTNSDGNTSVSSTATTSTQIPPLVPTASGTAVSGATTRELGGINPAEPLAAVPARNPFRPLTLEKDGVAATTPVVGGAGNATPLGNAGSPSFPEPSVGITPPGDFTPSVSGSSPFTSTTSSSSFPDTTASNSSGGRSTSSSTDSSISTTTWTLGPDDTPVAITSGSSAGSAATGSRVTGSSSSNSAGSSITSSRPASPTPTASSNGRTNAGSTSGAMESWDFGTPDSPVAVTSGTSGNNTGGTGTGGTGSANSGSSATAPAASTSPAAPAAPVAGVTAPGLGTIANRPAPSANSSAASSNTATAGTPGAATGNAPSISVPLPTPGQPELITQYGNNQGIGAPDDGTVLSRTLNRQNVRFTGAVLGPNNTAIFKSNDGFMVLEQGDVLPDTNIRVTGINTNSVTLALGGETLTLELEPLQQAAAN